MANIRKRGDNWQVKIQRKGMPVLYQTFAKKSDAAVWARQIEASIDRGETPDEVGPMATTTFGELIARYQAEVTVTKRSARQENYRMKRFLAHPMSKLHLKDLTTGVFAGYRNERSKSCGPQQVRHELNLMGHIIRTATIDWDFPFGKNPVDLIRKPKIPPGRTRRLIPGELEKMGEGMEKSESTYLIPMIEFAIETAMRRGEILGLEWRNFNFRTNTVLLPMTKNGHPRTVPLSSKAKGNPPVFSGV